MQVAVHQNYVAGRWLASGATLPVINPSDGSKMAEIARGGASEIDAAIAAGHVALAGSGVNLTPFREVASCSSSPS